VLRAAGLPIAAPSANLFGRPSPTRAAHVLADLDGRIDVLLDGGPTPVGVESTIVDLSTTPPRLLRPGGVPAEALEAVLGVELVTATRSNNEGPQTAPGMLTVHYSPRTPLTLIVGQPDRARARLRSEVAAALVSGKRVGVLALEEDLVLLPSHARVEVVGTWGDANRSAARLFEALRAIDAEDLDGLFVRELADPSIGLGRALADRLRRASHRVLDAQD
jgi:L-threonylcarbamoyladenylate synthase